MQSDLDLLTYEYAAERIMFCTGWNQRTQLAKSPDRRSPTSSVRNNKIPVLMEHNNCLNLSIGSSPNGRVVLDSLSDVTPGMKLREDHVHTVSSFFYLEFTDPLL